MRTTININNSLEEKLKNNSALLDISTHDLIAMLINTVITKKSLKISLFNSLQYQDADPKKNWRRLHVSFDPQVYEKSLDLRKCFKLSVSFIISFAIIHFLDELTEKLMNSNDKNQVLDNYPQNYIFLENNYNGVQGFIIFWGIPGEKLLKHIIP